MTEGERGRIRWGRRVALVACAAGLGAGASVLLTSNPQDATSEVRVWIGLTLLVGGTPILAWMFAVVRADRRRFSTYGILIGLIAAAPAAWALSDGNVASSEGTRAWVVYWYGFVVVFVYACLRASAVLGRLANWLWKRRRQTGEGG